MPTFVYQVKDEKGRKYLGVAEADSEGALKRSLRDRGWYVFNIRHFQESGRRFFFKRRANLNSLILFSHQLTSTLEAGITILNALDIMWKQTEDPMFQMVISQLNNKLSQGKSLSEAFRCFPDIFPPVYQALIHVAEMSGNLPKVLRKLCAYLAAQKEFILKIRKAVAYPLIVIWFSVFIVVILLLWVVPIFETAFAKIKVDLPLFTKMVIGLSSTIRSVYFWVFIGFVSALVFHLYKRYSATPDGQEKIDGIKLKIPILGKILYDEALARFSRTLSLLLESGLPIGKSIGIAKNTVLNRKITKALDWVEERLLEGAPIHTSLDATGVFPIYFIEMISIGEESGALGDVLEKTAVHFEEELDYMLSKFLSSLEPMLIIFIGGVVVFIMLSIYLPIFKLWDKTSMM